MQQVETREMAQTTELTSEFFRILGLISYFEQREITATRAAIDEIARKNNHRSLPLEKCD
jgi:hypothetical protein